MTPMPWLNVLANPTFGTIVSESGSASTWSENAQLFRLTPWSNDPISDTSAEAIYIRDEDSGRFWSPTAAALRAATGRYVTRHGFGYSVFEHARDGIESELTLHVAIDAPVKFFTLVLRNRSARARRLSVTGYVDCVLGGQAEITRMHVSTRVDPQTGALLAGNPYNTRFRGTHGLLRHRSCTGRGRRDQLHRRPRSLPRPRRRASTDPRR